MGWIEATMAHSGNADTGTEAGVKEASWNTTVQMENQSVCPLRKLPVTIITGNRPCNATPASAIEGARWITIASSTQCKKNGLSICYLTGHAADEGAEGAGGDAARSKQQQAMLANDMSTGDVRSDIRVIDRVTAQNNMLYFLLLQWLRKDVTLLCSSLTIDPRRGAVEPRAAGGFVALLSYEDELFSRTRLGFAHVARALFRPSLTGLSASRRRRTSRTRWALRCCAPCARRARAATHSRSSPRYETPLSRCSTTPSCTSGPAPRAPFATTTICFPQCSCSDGASAPTKSRTSSAR
jgi:hypothetical protein